MKYQLRYIYNACCIFLSLLCCSQTDSLLNKKAKIWVEGSIGIPIINKLQIFNKIDIGNNDPIWVDSKRKPIYNFGLMYQKKHFILGFSSSLIQNEYTGSVFAYGLISNSGAGNTFSTHSTYSVHQTIKSNIFLLQLRLGYQVSINNKNIFKVINSLSINIKDDEVISNFYSGNPFGADTVKYALRKNQKVKENVSNCYLALGTILGYEYIISDKLKAGINLSFQYFLPSMASQTFEDKLSIFTNQENTNGAYFKAYGTVQQYILYPTLNFSYKLY